VKRPVLVSLLVVVSVVVAGCSIAGAVDEDTQPVTGRMEYEIVDVSSAELTQGELAEWYDTHHVKRGLHSFTAGDYLYILLSAGEKPTGGYALEDLVLYGTETEIEVTANLRCPGEDEMVTQALTYPHLLVRIPDDDRHLVLGGISGEETVTEAHVDSGRYVGQVDSNSIEIRISGVPDEIAPRVFQLSDELKERFDEYELETGDEILFTYVPSEGRQPVIVEIRKMH